MTAIQLFHESETWINTIDPFEYGIESMEDQVIVYGETISIDPSTIDWSDWDNFVDSLSE